MGASGSGHTDPGHAGSGHTHAAPSADGIERRTFLTRLTFLAMAGWLAAAFAGLASIAGRFLLPRAGDDRRWLYVAEVARMPPGGVVPFVTPDGEPVTVARLGAGGGSGDFVALSTTCPHLGCRVHWEAHRSRFFCPCHNGVFDPGGRALSGPPADAGQSLSRHALRVHGGLIYISVSVRPPLGGAA